MARSAASRRRLIDLMRASWDRYMKIKISPERKRELDAWCQGFHDEALARTKRNMAKES